MSFADFLQSKTRPGLTVVLDAYEEALRRDVYDALLDPARRPDFVREHLAEIYNVPGLLAQVAFPAGEEMLMAVATREPRRIRRCHERFAAWAEANPSPAGSKLGQALLECRSFLYGRDIPFSKEMAEDVIRQALAESGSQAAKAGCQVEEVVKANPHWGGSSLLLKPVKTEALTAEEFDLTVGQLLDMRLGWKAGLVEVRKIQPAEGQPVSLREDYAYLGRALAAGRVLTETYYLRAGAAEEKLLRRWRRDLALGLEVALPDGLQLESVSPQEGKVWKLKVKNKAGRQVLRWAEPEREKNEK